MTFLENNYEEGRKEATDVIETWKKKTECQNLRDNLEKIKFRSIPDGGEIICEDSSIVCPGKCVTTNSKPTSRGTIGSICSWSENDTLNGRRYAITCGHVVGKENVECLVSTGQPDEKPALLGRSDVVIKSDDYEGYTVDISAIAVENKNLHLEPFRNQKGDFVKLSLLKLSGSPKSIVGRNVQKIGAKTKLTKGKVTEYHFKLRTAKGNRELNNVIEIKGTKGQFTDSGDSGAVVTDLLDGSTQKPCAIGLHISKFKRGKGKSSLCSPMQVTLGALVAKLRKKYRLNLKLLENPESSITGKIVKDMDRGYPVAMNFETILYA